MVLQGSLLGLAAAHRRGVVHRDYKPENVLVDGAGASKLTDFGMAARAGDSPRPGGTLMYAPPEQFAGGLASPAGDVYAATATFFECLTGHPPFRGENAAGLWYQHMSRPVPVEEVPEPLRPLVAAGMAKQPEDRPADAATFVAALNTVAARAYGPDWEDRGRSHLGEAALLLAAMWPSGGPPAVQGITVEKIPLRRRHRRSQLRYSAAARAAAIKAAIAAKIPLRRRHWRSQLRHSAAIKAAIAAGLVVAVGIGTILVVHLTGSGPAHPVALPAVTGVSPASGTTTGGTAVTITGSGLADATAVRFGGVAGTITADSATQITVTSPPSTGAVDITVTTPAGTSRPSTAGHYTYTDTAPQPMVTGVSPDSGSTAGGTTVSITGTGLAGATGVRFGGAAAAVTADSATQITVTSPPGTGTVTITVITPAGTATTAGAGRYAYTTRPELTQSISFTVPASGTAGGSTTLSATGGGSGNPVVFSVDPASGPGVCTVSGTTVSYTAAGSCVIDANQAGNASYTAAPQVQRTITVQPATTAGKTSQSISFTAPASGTAGGSAHLSATGGGSGNPVVFSVGPASGRGVCTVSGTTVTYTAAGSCVIDANQVGTASYAAAPQVQRTITVTGMSQSISFTAPASGVAGGSAHLSATGGGSGNPVVFSVAPASGPGVCTVSGTTVTYTAAGSCVIDANQAGTASYAAAPQVQQAITVTGWTAGEAPLPANAAANPDAGLFSVACPSASSCVAAGLYTDSSGGEQELLVTGSGTSWTAAEAPLPANAAANPGVGLGSVACASVSSCVAAGEYPDSSGNGQGLLVTGSGTSWTAAEAPLPANAAANPVVILGSVACPSASSCVAAGNYGVLGGLGRALLVTGSGTSWTAVEAPLPANAALNTVGSLFSVACPSASSCVAAGGYVDSSGNGQGLLVTGSGTSWTAAEAPLPANAVGARLITIACPSVSSCVAAGGYTDSSGNGQGLLVTGSGTSWTAAEVPLPANAAANPDVQLFSVACPSASFCVAAGTYTDSSGGQQELLVTGSGTSWTAAEAPLPANAAANTDAVLSTIACPSASSCIAAGKYTDSSGNEQGLLVTGTGTSWTTVEAPLPANASANYPDAFLNTIACPSASSCVAAGGYVDSSGNTQGLLVTGPG